LKIYICTYGSNKVSDVGHGSTGGTTKVKDLAAWLHVDVFDTTDDGCSELGSEGVPHSVFNLFSCFLDLFNNIGKTRKVSTDAIT
jgi:hypothetical protein